MESRRLIIAIVLLVTCGVALLATYLLLQSVALASGLVAGVVGLVTIFISPFVGLINYLLFLYIRPQDYMSGMVGLPIMLMIGAGTMAMMVVHMAIRDRAIRFVRAPQNLFVFWFMAAIAASHLATLYIPLFIEATTGFLSTVVMYLLISNLVTSPKRLKIVVNLIVVLTIVLALQGIVQYFTGAGFGGQETYEGRIQAVGIFSDPNDLALALVIVLPFVFLKLVEPAPTGEKILALISMLILVYALYLTQSRGGLLAFGLLMFLLFTRRFGLAAGLAAGAVIMAAIFAFGQRMSSISTEEASAYGRVQAWGLGIDLFETHPLFGVGAGEFTEYHFRTAHNSFVLCAAELGMFGLYPWVMLFYISIKNNDFISKHMREGKLIDVAIYVDTVRYGLMAFALAAYFLSRTYSELLFILAALSAAITHMFVMESGERYSLIERKDFVKGFGWTIVGWIVTKLFLYVAW